MGQLRNHNPAFTLCLKSSNLIFYYTEQSTTGLLDNPFLGLNVDILDKLEHLFSTFFIKTLPMILRTRINNAMGSVAIVLPQSHLLSFLNKILAFIMALFHQVNRKIIINIMFSPNTMLIFFS